MNNSDHALRPLTTTVRMMIAYGERLIQGCILVIILFGWYLSTFQVGLDWLVRRKASYVSGVSYLLSVNVLIASVAGLYLYLTSGRYTHNVTIYSFPDKELLTEPYHCLNASGDLDTCKKGKCAGKWKPPRTHHCTACGVCRLEFDHHCPWIGTCVTLSNLKVFLCMLSLLPITFAVAISPVFNILVSHIFLALEVSRQDEWANRVWWDWLGSWIFCSGPIGRWPVGIILGFVIIGDNRPRDRDVLPGYLIEEPHLSVIATAAIVLFLSCFAIGLAFGSVRKISQGVTTLETLRPLSGRGHSMNFICIPQSPRGETIYASVLPHEKIYDLGAASNWRLFVTRPLIAAPVPNCYIWPKLNPRVIHRIRSTQFTEDLRN